MTIKIFYQARISKKRHSWEEEDNYFDNEASFMSDDGLIFLYCFFDLFKYLTKKIEKKKPMVAIIPTAKKATMTGSLSIFITIFLFKFSAQAV